MSQELHYTSVPRGLKPGSRGFCSVAWTPEIPGPLVERLEGLSGYQPIYPPHDPAAARNPINFSHIRLTLGPRTMNVLSRIGPAGLDYTGRANKYAHHVVLETNERSEAGPAWLLSQPGFLQAAWEGEPRVLTEGRPVLRATGPRVSPRRGKHSPEMADGPACWPSRSWPTRAASCSWSSGPAWISSPCSSRRSRSCRLHDAGKSSSAPISPSSRTEYLAPGAAYSRAPPRLGTPRRLPTSLVIDLCQPTRRAQGGALVHMARTGERRDEPAEGIAVAVPQVQSRAPVPLAMRATPISGAPPRTIATSEAANYGLIPELAARMRPHGSLHPNGKNSPSRRRTRTGILISGVIAACLIPLFAAGIILGLGLGNKPENGSADSSKTITDGKDNSRADGQEVQPQTDRSQFVDKPAGSR